MKKWMFAFLTLFMVACQQDNGGGGGGGTVTPTTTVTTPLTTNCLDGTTYCNNTLYNNYQGFIPYPGMYRYAYDYRAYFNTHGFCNCPGGYMPVYNGSYGLGCVRQQYLNPYSGHFMYWQWGTGQIGYGRVPGYGSGYNYGNGYGNGVAYPYSAPQIQNNWPQFSNIPSASNSYGNCSRNLTQSCVIGQVNSCGVGATCRQVVQGSGLGVCVSGY